MTYEVVAGWTAAIDVDLLSKGTTPSGSMAGYSVELVLMDMNGNQVNTSGDSAVQDATNWVVRYTPDAADLVPGEYRGRFKVTDGSGGIAYFPSGDWDTWKIRTAGY